MPPACILPTCKNSVEKQNKQDGITYHRFPVDEERRAQWTKIVQRARIDQFWKPSKRSILCSIHFEDKFFYITKCGNRRLTKEAYPNRNLAMAEDFESQLPTQNRNLSIEKDVDASNQNLAVAEEFESRAEEPKIAEPLHSPLNSEIGDVDITDLDWEIFDTPRETKLKSQLRRSQKLAQKHVRKIKSLQQKKRRLTKKIHAFKNILGNLKNKHRVKDDVYKLLSKSITLNRKHSKVKNVDGSDQFPNPPQPQETSDDASSDDNNSLSYEPSDLSDFLVFNEPSGSRGTSNQLQYQDSRYSMFVNNQDDAKQSAVEEIIIKEEVSEDENRQCRLCLSVGRNMKELGEYAPLYKNLLFEHHYQNTTLPAFMLQLLACWECRAKLRKMQQFQQQVRMANAAFETKQNKNCSSFSSLITVSADMNKVVREERHGMVKVKEELIEMEIEMEPGKEIEETGCEDPLEGNGDTMAQGDPEDSDNPSEAEEQIKKQKVIPPRTQQLKSVERVQVKKRDEIEPKPVKKVAKPIQKPVQKQKETNVVLDCDSMFGKVKIEYDELKKILEVRRNKESFKSMEHKCESCVLGFTDHDRLVEHGINYHNENAGSIICDICQRRFTDDALLAVHHRNHFVKFVCKLCNFECYTKTGRTTHFKRHKGMSQGATSGTGAEPSASCSQASASSSL